MLDRVHYRAVRRGLIIAVDGLALWFLGFVLAAYGANDTLPWESWLHVLQDATEFTRQLAVAPVAGSPELLASTGLVLLVIGPTIDWILIPLLSRADVRLTVPGDERIRRFVRRIRNRL